MAGGWYGHHEAHRQAALKGWANRRRGALSMTAEGVIMPRRAQPTPRTTRPAPTKAAPTKAPVRGQRVRQPLTPITRIPDAHIDPYGPPDVDLLRQLYGEHQLRNALDRYTVEELKRAARLTQKRHPNTAPRDWRSKRHLLDYLEHPLAPTKTRQRKRNSMSYAQFAAELDRLMTVSRRGNNPYAAPEAMVLMSQHRAYTARYRREREAR